MAKMRNRPGFTFLETLVVMIVLGLLSAIAVPRYRNYKERAYMAGMKNDLGLLRIAQEAYWAEHQQYATDTVGLDYRRTSNVDVAITSVDVIGGYTAVATHVQVPGQQCMTSTGKEAGALVSGSIYCGPAPSGSGTLPNHAP